MNRQASNIEVATLSLEQLARLLGAPSLDKLETTSENYQTILNASQLFAAKKLSQIPTLSRRANSKAVTERLSHALLTQTASPLFKAYQATACCSSFVVEEEGRYKSKYCNNRWCLVCNRIKTAKYINDYTPMINDFAGKRFVTLTTPNVKAEKLADTIALMNKQWYQIRDQKRKSGIKLKGIRKLEVTYNPDRNDYHPHYHIVLEGSESLAGEIIDAWIEKDNSRSPKAQDNSPCDEGSLKELFKYFTKITSDKKDVKTITIPALDHIFQVLKGKRVFQSFGMTKPKNLPDLEQISQAVAEKLEIAKEYRKWLDLLPVQESYLYYWDTQRSNWIDYRTNTGTFLTNYQQTDNVRTFDQRFMYEIKQRAGKPPANTGRHAPADHRQSSIRSTVSKGPPGSLPDLEITQTTIDICT